MTKPTGWGTGLCQDYDRGLALWFASRLNARHTIRRWFGEQRKTMTVMTNEDPADPSVHEDELGLPHWAIGISSTPIVGSQLCTRDGRRMGNAVIVSSEDDNDWGRPMFTCVTDVGTTMKLTALEIEECFHPLHFVMDPARHPGVERLAAKAMESQWLIGSQSDMALREFKAMLAATQKGN